MFANPPSPRPRAFESSLNESIARLEAPGDAFVSLFLYHFDDDDDDVFDVRDDDDGGNIQLRRDGGGSSQRLEADLRRRLLLDRLISLLAKHRGDLEVAVHFKRDRLPAEGTNTDAEHSLDKPLSELFQNVLPNHPTLRIIEFLDLDRPSTYIRMFVESLSNTVERRGRDRPLLTVTFLDCSQDAHIGAAVASMLASNCPVEKVIVVGCGPGTDGLKRICDSAGCSSRHMRNLTISDRSVRARLGEATATAAASSSSSSSSLHSPTTVLEDTMVRAVSAASPLRSLHVSDLAWTDEGLAAIARGLRTNERLEEFLIRSDDDAGGGDASFLEVMKETLTTYNWTLRYPPNFRMFWKLLDANERVRDSVSVLTKTNYRVDHMALWPLAMGILSAKPTLLYRFLRRGNMDAFSSRFMKPQAPVAPASTPPSSRGVVAGKKRRAPDKFETEDDSAPL
jgi:hypothetical protein